jgi:hypothetical protein
MATPNFPFTAGRRNTVNISRLYDTSEKTTCKIEGVICVTKICYMRCIFADMQKRFIASALNGITTPKKIRDRTLIQIDWKAYRFSVKLRERFFFLSSRTINFRSF